MFVATLRLKHEAGSGLLSADGFCLVILLVDAPCMPQGNAFRSQWETGRKSKLSDLTGTARCSRAKRDRLPTGSPLGQANRRQTRMPGGVGGVTGAILSPRPDWALLLAANLAKIS